MDDKNGQGRHSGQPVELAVIVPTYNELLNIGKLYSSLDKTLQDVCWEMIVVDDDSPDGTAKFVRELAEKYSNIRVLQRIGRRGLSTAVIEGMLATSASKLAVIDGDLQHDETKLPAMLEILRNGETDIVVGSRYVEGGSVGDWDTARVSMSSLATRLSRLVFQAELKDPMSGFFMIRRDAFERVVRNLSGEGYKILLDIFATAKPPLRFDEVSYIFRSRQHGESKLDGAVLWGYLVLIIDKWLGNYIPARLFLFGLVGGFGVVIHFSVLSLSLYVAHIAFTLAQFMATLVAMTFNYIFNNIITYRDKSKSGLAFVRGLMGFYLICSVGLIGNVGVASAIFNANYQWWAAVAVGIVIGTIWNYAASAMFIWRRE